MKDAPKSKYIVKPKLVRCDGGPFGGQYVRAYDWKGPDAEVPFPDGRYLLEPAGEKKPKKDAVQTHVYVWKAA